MEFLHDHLAAKPEVAVYQWPDSGSRRFIECWNCGLTGHIAANCPHSDYDDEDDEDYDHDIGGLDYY